MLSPGRDNSTDQHYLCNHEKTFADESRGIASPLSLSQDPNTEGSNILGRHM
jgi:hypothetical protein